MSPRRPPPGTGTDSDLFGQTVALIGSSSRVGLETARLARNAGATVVLTGRDHPDPLRMASRELTPWAVAGATDAADPVPLEQFLTELAQPLDHLLVTCGVPYQAPLADFDFTRAQRDVDEQLWLPMRVARAALCAVRPGGTLLFLGGTGNRGRGVGRSLVGALTAARAALIANLALELAPIRVNLIGAWYVDRPLSARLLGETLNQPSDERRATRPIARVVRPTDVARLAVYVMANQSLTGAVFAVDGGKDSSSTFDGW